MTIESVDDQMIEIGDPTEEPTVLPVPPRVMIEYRDRGVPWMLIPPLLVLSSVGAILLHGRFNPPPADASKVAQVSRIKPEVIESPPKIEVAGPVVPVAETPKPTIPVEQPDPPVTVAEVVAAPVSVETPGPGPMADPVIRDEGLGFDPRALDAAREADPAFRPVAGQEGPRNPPIRDEGPALGAEARDQPEEVDPGLLPADPKQTIARRAQRIAEARRQADADRVQFHAELRVICRKSGVRGVPQISKLCKQYGMEIEPSVKQRAAQLLGKAGSYEGAGRAMRINLLRSLGFPEPTILGDLMDNETRYESTAVRGGLANHEEALFHASLLLLNFPPNRPTAAATTRPVSSSRPSPLAGPGSSR